MGKWEGERATKRIENDLNRLEYNLNRTKGNRIRHLQRKKLGLTVENNSRGESSEGDTGAFIQECRRERCRKRKERKINKDRKRRYKCKQRRKRDTRADSAWKEILKRADEIVRDMPQDHTPFDNTGVEWDQSKLDLMRKGQKFVPAPRRIDLVAKFNHLNDLIFFNNKRFNKIKDLRSSFLIFTPKNSQFLKPQNLLQLLLISICFSREIEATI